MASLNVFGKLLTSSTDFKNYILKTVTETVNKRLFSKLAPAEDTIRDIVISSIKAQPEYASLKSGELRNRFGIQSAAQVDEVLTALGDIDAKIDKARISGDEITAQITINMIKSDFATLGGGAGTFVSEGGSLVDWLSWLLYEGNNSVVIGYKYKPKVSPKSRTGKGIMVKGEGNIFRVPPEFAGTADDNWITRGVDAALPQIQDYFNKIVKKAL